MLKTRNRWVSLLVAVVMVAGLLIPFVGTASALATYSITSVNNITAGTGTPQQCGNTEAIFDVPTWTSINSTNGYVYASLPSSPNGYAYYLGQAGGTGLGGAPLLNVQFGGGTVGNTGVNGCTIVGADPVIGDNHDSIVTITGSSLVPVGGTGFTGSYPQELNISVYTAGVPTGNPNNMTVELPLYIFVPSGVTGGVTQTLAAQSSSVWSSGTGTIAIVGNSTVSIAAESTPAVTTGLGVSGSTLSNSIGLIDVTENAAGALNDGSNSALTFTLPPGFSWNSPTFEQMWGSTTAFAAMSQAYSSTGTYAGSGWTITDNSRELKIYDNGSTAYPLASSTSTGGSVFFKIVGSVTVDEATAQTGNITVSIGGNTSANVSSLVVGSYGNFGLTSDASGTAPTIIAGKAGSTIGEFEVKEGTPGSLIPGRTITLTLPTTVAWAQEPTLDTNLSTNTGDLAFTWQSEGSNGNEIQGTETAATGTAGQTSPADLFFKNMEVTPAVDFSGPVAVTVGGSEGLTGTVTLATVTAGVTAAASTTPNIGIGTASQTLGDITITEGAAGNLDADATYSALENDTADLTQILATDETTSTEADLDIVAPVGVTFDTTPTVTVTAGNMQLGTVTTGTGLVVGDSTLAGNQGVLVIPIQSSSTTASTIKIAAPVVTLDRTVASGPIDFKVEGPAVDETTFGVDVPDFVNTPTSTFAPLFPNDSTAVAVDVAMVGPNGSSVSGGTSVFTIGQDSYTANGNTVTMDVAPYIKDSRTFLPVRYIANALGVPDSNISWNNGQVVINKGGTLIIMTIGSMTMSVGGSSITMDAAPEITDGRTCLPIAWVALALNANITWNATAQTVTVISN